MKKPLLFDGQSFPGGLLFGGPLPGPPGHESIPIPGPPGGPSFGWKRKEQLDC